VLYNVLLLDICSLLCPKPSEAKRLRQYRKDIKEHNPEKYEESKLKSNNRYLCAYLCFRICFSALAKSTSINRTLTSKLEKARENTVPDSTETKSTKKES